MSEQTYIYALHDPRDWSIRYIGKANDPWKRLAQHRYKKSFQTFQITILSVCKISEWEHWEKFWIATARASGADLWNVTDGGNGRGIQIPFSLKHRANLRVSASLRKHSPETRLRLSEARKRRKISETTRAKTSASLKGRTLSAFHRAKIGIANKGKKLPPQSLNTIEKRKAALFGQKRSAEYCARMSVLRKGEKRSPETCAKISQAQKGRNLSQSHRANQSAAQKMRWQKIRQSKDLGLRGLGN
jgi:hypothetical protein